MSENLISKQNFYYLLWNKIQWNIEIHVVVFGFVWVKCLYKLYVESIKLVRLKSIWIDSSRFVLYMGGIWVPIVIARALFLRRKFFLVKIFTSSVLRTFNSCHILSYCRHTHFLFSTFKCTLKKGMPLIEISRLISNFCNQIDSSNRGWICVIILR